MHFRRFGSVPRVSARRRAGMSLALVVALTSCRRPSEGAPRANAGAPDRTSLIVAERVDSAAATSAIPSVPPVVGESAVAPVYTPEQSLAQLRLPDGYRAELVAAEPLVHDPVAVDFDADGRMYVVEMRAYMPNIRGEGEDRPIGRIVVLEDVDDDGRMDKSTVFLDSLVLPRAVKVLERGVLVAAPPNLFLARDTTGDLVADVTEIVRRDYGSLRSNPEHNANGLQWGIDNWLHNANWAGQLRVRDRDFAYRWTPSIGQWGVSADDYGRQFRNSNEDPLRASVIPTHYAARDSGGPRVRGIYDPLTPNVAVWPARKTPAVNRGYRPQTLRPDSTLAHYTAAGSPTTFIGDRLPSELRRSVFVTESAGNLVGRFVVDEHPDGSLSARPAYERREFLASTDERFRPVNLASAPDGTLYVVDMYRGIIQHRVYITDYLAEKIKERGLDGPVGMGRVYRIVHSSTRRGPRPLLSRATPGQLVAHLSHPNGWWRITAQRLIVERQLRSVASALRALFHSAPDDRTRLHALWTLEGLDSIDESIVIAAMADSSPHVRAAGMRVGEPLLAQSDAVRGALLRLIDDDAPIVRRQLAASIGELAEGARQEPLLRIALRHGSDPVVSDLVGGAVRGREIALLERLLAADATASVTAPPAEAVRTLAARVARRRVTAPVERLIAWAVSRERPRWQRLAILEALSESSGQGGRATIALLRRPDALLAVAAGRDSALADRARRTAQSLDWPQKAGGERAAVRPLTRAEQQRLAAGRTQYQTTCAACHHATGSGQTGLGKSLIRSPWVLGDPGRLVRIVQHGKEGEKLMPPVGSSMTADELAAVLTYIRRSWGNDGTPVDPALVREVRGATTGRNRPWTDAELQRAR